MLGIKSRLTLSIADQAMSSVSNVGMAIVAARLLSPREFGAVSLAFAVYIVLLGLVRSLVAEPLLASEPGTEYSKGSMVVGTSIAISLPFAYLLVLIAIFAPAPLGPVFGILAVSAPALAGQDALRYLAFYRRRPGHALVIDTIWVVAAAAAVLLCRLSGVPLTGSWALATWGIGAGVSLLVGSVVMRCGFVLDLRFLKDTRSLGLRYLTEFGISQGAAQLNLLLLSLICGLPAVGVVRSAQVLFGPINIIYAGVYAVVVPEGARLQGDGPRLRFLCACTSLGLFLVGLACFLCYMWLPYRWGISVFGGMWVGARHSLVPAALAVLTAVPAAGAIAGLRSRGAARASLHARLVVVIPTLILPSLGAAAIGANGFLWMSVAASAMATLTFWFVFIRLSAPPSLECDSQNSDGRTCYTANIDTNLHRPRPPAFASRSSGPMARWGADSRGEGAPWTEQKT